MTAPAPLNFHRRALLAAGLGACVNTHALPPKTLVFPRDDASHPDFATEWWYVTGYATTDAPSSPRAFGFQVTFFRSRVPVAQSMTSKFAAKQLVFAHAAITDIAGKKLLHDQRIARDGFEVALASTDDTHVRIKDWFIQRQPASATRAITKATAPSTYTARVIAPDFSLELTLAETQPVLLQGDGGLSRKGPDPAQASYYYSKPQLAVAGVITLGGQALPVKGTAWLDHEWSQALMPPDAVGWDWIGMNLFDGSALTAFRLRDAAGKALWDGGSFRTASGQRFGFSQGEVIFSRQRSWKSAQSQASYGVEWIVRTPADFYTVKAVIDNQELDSRQSTGAIYWEGLSDLFDSNGKHVGRGYLEMTGYAKALRL